MHDQIFNTQSQIHTKAFVNDLNTTDGLHIIHIELFNYLRRQISLFRHFHNAFFARWIINVKVGTQYFQLFVGNSSTSTLLIIWCLYCRMKEIKQIKLKNIFARTSDGCTGLSDMATRSHCMVQLTLRHSLTANAILITVFVAVWFSEEFSLQVRKKRPSTGRIPSSYATQNSPPIKIQ